MKSLIRPAGFVVLSGLLIFFGAKLLLAQETSQVKSSKAEEVQDTTTQETYVSQVIISTPWAEKNLVYDGEESPPGEFGLHSIVFPDSLREKLPDPPLPEGPTSFTIGPNGDIYITDPLNKRIQRFDDNGNFISVIPIPSLEKREYLHIQELPETSDSARMESLRRAGKLPKDGKVPPKPKTVNGYQYVWSLICVDRYNNVYLLWWGDYTKQTLCKYDPLGNLIATYPFFPEVRSRGAGNKLYCDNSDKLFFEYYRKLTDEVILSREDERLLKKPYELFNFQIGTVDQVFTPGEQEATLQRGGREIPDFSKIKERAWKELPGKFWGPEIWDYEYVNEEGEFYHYWPTKEGMTITKWSKQ